MISGATCVNAYYGDSVGRVIIFGKNYVVSETRSDAVLGMYDVGHL